MMSESPSSIRVWDIPTRLFHWGIVILLAFQWFSIEIMDDWMDYHELGGYALLTLILFRILWGFWGTLYARFSDFLHAPKHILTYIKTIHLADSRPYAGHNPMGGIAVVVLLTLLLLQAVSGLFMTDDIFFYGPYYSAVNDEIQKLMSRLHNLTFDVLLWFIGIHIATIAYYELFKKQRLIKAMFTGEKHGVTGDSINKQKVMLAVIVLALCVAGVYGLVVLWAPETIDYF